MKTFVFLKNEYFLGDTSRYMMSVARQTIIPSLKAQCSKGWDFHMIVSAMDPFYKYRMRTFRDCCERRFVPAPHQEMPPDPEFARSVEVPHLQIVLPDDVILTSGFIRALKIATEQWEIQNPGKSVTVAIPDGLFFDGEVLRHCPWNRSGIYVYYEAGTGHSGSVLHFTESIVWIRVKHFYSIDLDLQTPESDFSMFQHVDVESLKRICKTRVAQATALGALSTGRECVESGHAGVKEHGVDESGSRSVRCVVGKHLRNLLHTLQPAWAVRPVRTVARVGEETNHRGMDSERH